MTYKKIPIYSILCCTTDRNTKDQISSRYTKFGTPFIKKKLTQMYLSSATQTIVSEDMKAAMHGKVLTRLKQTKFSEGLWQIVVLISK